MGHRECRRQNSVVSQGFRCAPDSETLRFADSTVTIFERRRSWARIATGLWVGARYLDITEPETTTDDDQSAASGTRTGTVRAWKLNARRGPGPRFRVVGSFGRGETVSIHEEQGNWLRVGVGPDQWVSGRYVDVS